MPRSRYDVVLVDIQILRRADTATLKSTTNNHSLDHYRPRSFTILSDKGMYVQSLRSSPSSREAPHPRLFAFLSILCSSESTVLGASLATHLASIIAKKNMNVVFCVVQYFELERKEKKKVQKSREKSFLLYALRIVGLTKTCAWCARLPF